MPTFIPDKQGGKKLTWPTTLSHYVGRACDAARRCASHGVLIFLRTSQSSFYPTVRICRAVKPRARNESQWRDNIYHPTRVQRLVTWLVRGLHHVPCKERFRNFKLFPLECRSLLSRLQGVSDLSSNRAEGALPQNIARTKPYSTKKRCLLWAWYEVLEKIAGC